MLLLMTSNFHTNVVGTKAKAREMAEMASSEEKREKKNGQVVKRWITCISRVVEHCSN